jgi:hypothetical protein
MAQYFDFPVKIPASDDAITDVIRAAWSDQDPIVAVATRNKKLWVAQEEVRRWFVVLFCFCFWVGSEIPPTSFPITQVGSRHGCRKHW